MYRNVHYSVPPFRLLYHQRTPLLKLRTSDPNPHSVEPIRLCLICFIRSSRNNPGCWNSWRGKPRPRPAAAAAAAGRLRPRPGREPPAARRATPGEPQTPDGPTHAVILGASGSEMWMQQSGPPACRCFVASFEVVDLLLLLFCEGRWKEKECVMHP